MANDKDEAEEVVYTPSTEQVYLDNLLNNPADPPVYNAAENPNPFHEDGYIGVSAEYANAANEYEEPLQAEEGPDMAAEEAFEDAYGDSSGEVTPQMEEAVAKVTRDDGAAEADAPAAKTTTTKKTAAKTSESSS
jgi:hypothetical protein